LARVALVDPAMRMNPVSGAERLPGFLMGVGEPPEVTLPALRAANPSWHECDFVWKGEALQQCRAEAVRGLCLKSGEWDYTERLAQVDVPLLLLVADPRYTALAPETLAAAERTLRPGRGRIVQLPGTSHNMYRDGFEPSLAALTSWLAES
jgi:pimeloyl-ACP methyl ester carboxylesterase